MLLTISIQLNGQLISDESYKDESFWKFRNELERCIIEKDTTELKKYLAERIHESNDGCVDSIRGCTKDEFISYYFGHNNEEEVWDEMLKVIRFGFYQIESEDLNYPVAHSKESYKAPSYLKNVNATKEVIILGQNVNIREHPSLKSRVIKQASFEKYRCDCNILTVKETTYQSSDGIDWLEIYLDQGKIGYVAEKYTSYSVIKEMQISRVKGKWKVIWYYHPPGC